MPGTWQWCLLATSDEGWEDGTQEDGPGWQNAQAKAQACVSFSSPDPTLPCTNLY